MDFHNQQVREKKHRLPLENYRGEVTVAFTVCVRGTAPFFISQEVVAVFTESLAYATAK